MNEIDSEAPAKTPSVKDIVAMMPRDIRRKMFRDIKVIIAADNGNRRRWKEVPDECVYEYIGKCKDVHHALKEFSA